MRGQSQRATSRIKFSYQRLAGENSHSGSQRRTHKIILNGKRSTTILREAISSLKNGQRFN
jgi:hypothetical protein